LELVAAELNKIEIDEFIEIALYCLKLIIAEVNSLQTSAL